MFGGFSETPLLALTAALTLFKKNILDFALRETCVLSVCLLLLLCIMSVCKMNVCYGKKVSFSWVGRLRCWLLLRELRKKSPISKRQCC